MSRAQIATVAPANRSTLKGVAVAGANGVVAVGSLSLPAPESYNVLSDRVISTTAIPPAAMPDFRALAASAAYFSTGRGVFKLNGHHYSAFLDEKVDPAVVRVRPINREDYERLLSANAPAT